MNELWLIILGILLGYGLLGAFVFVFSYALSDKLEEVREVSLMVAAVCLVCFIFGSVVKTVPHPFAQENNMIKTREDVKEK